MRYNQVSSADVRTCGRAEQVHVLSCIPKRSSENVSIDVLDTPDVPRYLRTMYSHGNNNWINPNNNYYAKLRNL